MFHLDGLNFLSIPLTHKGFGMTIYSYTLVLNESEVIMLKEALKLMLRQCETEHVDGAKPPFWVWKQSERMLCRNYTRTLN